MNRALAYLWFALLKRRILTAAKGLCRTTTLIGFVALGFAFSVLFYYRQHEFFRNLFRSEILIGGGLVMLGGSVFKGFFQRGLAFEQADVEFLFTGPFTQRHIVIYRLLPGYLFSICQSVVFLVLFASHLRHPVWFAICLALFQIATLHIAAATAIWAGGLSIQTHYRLRWILIVTYLFICALYLRTAWGLKLVPAFVSSSMAQLFFYPATTVSDIAAAPVLSEWSFRLSQVDSALQNVWEPVLYLGLFSLVTLTSFRFLLRQRGDVFEPALATTTRIAERRRELQQGRSTSAVAIPKRSVSLPRLRIFQGVGAIVWKNFVAAFRSRRELALAGGFTVIYTGFLVALRWLFHHYNSQDGQVLERNDADFDNLIGGMLCILVFLLQRAFPFDFRRDGNHLVEFRALPVSPFALTLAELTVPTVFCFALQMLGLLALVAFAQFDWRTALVMPVYFLAMVLALNGVWNLYYLLAATKRVGGKKESSSPVALLMVVVLSFLVFYPAGWTAIYVGKHTTGRFSEALAAGAGLAIQFGVNVLLVVLLAKLFERFQVARTS